MKSTLSPLKMKRMYSKTTRDLESEREENTPDDILKRLKNCWLKNYGGNQFLDNEKYSEGKIWRDDLSIKLFFFKCYAYQGFTFHPKLPRYLEPLSPLSDLSSKRSHHERASLAVDRHRQIRTKSRKTKRKMGRGKRARARGSIRRRISKEREERWKVVFERTPSASR